MDTAKFKKMLLDERDRLELEHRIQTENLAEPEAELANYDSHPADTASNTYERTKEYAIDGNIEELIQRIDDALRKIEDGSYGICDRCKTKIKLDRLRAIPYATLCIDCQESLERY
ncbi:MAG: TraR/DksA C4-type zinc finger protein [Armatimonadetes bacterium]|nr:TraR/DksA C4-type zinc finger protein [Armatimonadota bacterium]